MRTDFNGDWKFMLLIGGILLAIFLVIGSLFSLVTGFLIFVFKGLGFVLGTIFRFAFSSIAGFLVLVAAAYLGYRGYRKLRQGQEKESNTVEYSNEDFER